MRIARENRGRLAREPSGEGAAEEKRRGEAVTGDVVAQPEDVARLLTAEHSALRPQRLEHIPVPYRCGDDANAALCHEAMEAQVRHHRDGYELDTERERQDRQDLIAVERLAALVDGEHAVPVPVECDTEV